MIKWKKIHTVMLLVIFVLYSFNVNVYGEEDIGSWNIKPSMPTARYSLGVVGVNDKIYAIGGNTDSDIENIVEEYNIVTEQWETKASMLTKRAYFGVVEVSNKIYAIGGSTYDGVTNIVEEYDPITDQWSTKSSMPTARTDLFVVTVNDKIYAIGGYTDSDISNIVEVYDPILDVWTVMSSVPKSIDYFGVTVANNKIYAIGGYSDGNNIVEEYDPSTDQWLQKSYVSTLRYYSGVATANNKIYSMGGYTDFGTSNTVDEYNIATNTWNELASMNTSKAYFGIAELNDKLYVVGGYGDEILDIVEEFTPPEIPIYRLNIESDSYKTYVNEGFSVNVKVEGEENIFIKDVTIMYDASLFELNDTQTVDPNIHISHIDESVNGQVSYTLQGKTSNNSTDGVATVLKLDFKAKSKIGIGDIIISSAKIENEEGTLMESICLGNSFNVKGSHGDVNSDGRFSYADLAIALKLFDTTSEYWEGNEPDVNQDGMVNDDDLSTILNMLLNAR